MITEFEWVPRFQYDTKLVRFKNICGRHPKSGINFVVAHMWDYYSVSAEEQRRMAENTIALCELLYSQQEIADD